ncbi:MAG: serine hydrolase [Actinomycetota bacterium]|nr:serine hydrolase [Actinomycetota bacterium]
MTARGLVPLPRHPVGLPWPTVAWPSATPPPEWDLGPRLGEMFSDEERFGTTYAVAVAHRGSLVFERYQGELEHWDRPSEPVGPGTGLLSWSVAKSVLHAAVEILVGQGRIDPQAPAPVAEWSTPGDPRGRISVDDLLTMRDGLDWVEDYDLGAERSDVITMLFGGEGAAGVEDMAGFAADRPLAAEPGSRFSYSSGTTNVLSGVVAGIVGRHQAYLDWLAAALFGPLGMTSARPGLDRSGTWAASSYLHASARDWLRFGELYLRDGVWEDRRLLPQGWVDEGRRPRSPDDAGTWFGAHWWTDCDDLGTFWASGYEGQTVTVCPGLDLVVVRFGRTPDGSGAVGEWRRALLRDLDPARDDQLREQADPAEGSSGHPAGRSSGEKSPVEGSCT